MIEIKFVRKISIVLLVLKLTNCGSVDVKMLNETEIDKQRLTNVDLTEVKLGNIGVLVKTSTDPKLKDEFGLGMETATVDLVKSLGGVIVVSSQKDWDEQFKQAQESVKKKLAEIKLNQQFGKSVELKKFESKWDAWYVLKADLVDIAFEKKYIQPKARGDREPRPPFWKIKTITTISFKVTSTEPGQDEKVVLIKNISNPYNTTFDNEPGKAQIVEAVIEGIKYNYEDAIPYLQDLFPVNSYISALREQKKYAKIIGGKDISLKPGRVFNILEKGNISTVIGNKEIYHPIGKIELFQVDDKESWGEVSGDEENIKVGMNIRIIPEEKTIANIIWRYVKSRLGIKS